MSLLHPFDCHVLAAAKRAGQVAPSLFDVRARGAEHASAALIVARDLDHARRLLLARRKVEPRVRIRAEPARDALKLRAQRRASVRRGGPALQADQPRAADEFGTVARRAVVARVDQLMRQDIERSDGILDQRRDENLIGAAA
jgi:hypothetical protein